MLHVVPDVVPDTLLGLASRSAAPDRVALAFARLSTEMPGRVEAMVDGGEPNNRARAFVAVVAASDSLARFCINEPIAHEVLGDLEEPVSFGWEDEATLALAHRLDILRTAARDLLGLDGLEQVTRSLSESAARVLDSAVSFAGEGTTELAVIGMGKLGAAELNYSSDVDIVFVAAPIANDDFAKRVVAISRNAFRVDVDLRPEGRAGSLTRTLDGYLSYWNRWAQTWEFQALIKANAVAGNRDLGDRFVDEAQLQVWDRGYSADELALIRRLKERSEALIASRGLTERELKRGPGGIRDVEFAVQLLQMVHGHNDPTIRSRATVSALSELAESGYLGTDQAVSLTGAYEFLRTVEHRLQLVEEQQTHTLPREPEAKERLARVLGFEGAPGSTATAQFDEALRICRTQVRSLHEKLFFRPLLEAFAVLPGARAPGSDEAPSGMSKAQIAERLRAFGFAGEERTKAAVEELAQGLTRSSNLMNQMLPLLLDWLSVTPDPDLGLLGLRNLALQPHNRSRLVTSFRESPEAARRLCLLLGSSQTLGEAVAHNPELMARLGDDDALAVSGGMELKDELADLLQFPSEDAERRNRVLRFKQEQLVRIAGRDLLDMDDVHGTEAALSSVAEAVLDAAIEEARPGLPFCVVGLGRFGGGELSYASDLDVLFIHGSGPGGPSEDLDPSAVSPGELAAERFLRLLHGRNPSELIFNLDLGLRPEGGQGRLSREVSGYAKYFERYALTWERQALLRARVVAGDRDLGAEFMDLVRSFVWEHSLDDDEVTEIRRMKARIERERIPSGEDPQFHLKLGKGSLSDVEWTVQLLQLRHGVPGPGTMSTLSKLHRQGFIDASDAGTLRESYEFCERTRNRWHLVGALPGGASPGDSLPTQPHQQSRLARSLGTTPTTLREDYRRVTRRARRVVEHLFYGIEST